MGKLLSEREAKLQKKLIPLNIFVCILALVAMFSLIFAPVLKIDFGKIMKSEAMQQMINDGMGKAVESGTEGVEGSGEVDFMPVVASLVTNVLSNAEGSVTFSVVNASKVAFASGDAKADKVLNEIKALINSLVDSIVNAVGDMFGSGEGKQLVEDIVITALTTSIIAGANDDAAEKLTPENVSALTATLKKLDGENNQGVSAEQAEQIANEFTGQLEGMLGESLNENDKEFVNDYIINIYEEASEYGDSRSLETILSVAVSKNVNLKDVNIGGMFGGGEEQQPEPEGSAYKRAVDGETEQTPDIPEGNEGEENPNPPEGGDGEETPAPPEGGDGEETPTPPEGGDGEETPNPPEGGDGEETPTPPEGGDGEETPTPPEEDDRVICTTYDGLLTEMGLGESDREDLKTNLSNSLHSMVDEMLGKYSEDLGYYGYLFYGMLAFIAPWAVLFLFSFFHMFAKNKRFMTWYVKLYCWVPGLISLAILLAPKVIDKVPALSEEGSSAVIKAMFGGISSMMWISGICYILLWLVSIFWAFPIKHKIRKERKFVKSTGQSYYDGGSSGGNKKNKKGKKAERKAVNAKGGNVVESQSHQNSYDSGYDSYGYDDPVYDDDYGADPEPYGSAYTGSYYDDDDDGFDSPYTGSYYGSNFADDNY